MPTYEYRCKECDNEFEIVQSFSDDALTVCESCGGPLRKVFGNVGIAFKGSGFYKNDSRSGGSKSSTSTKADATSSSTTDAGSPSSSDSTASSGNSDSSSGSSESAPAKSSDSGGSTSTSTGDKAKTAS